MYTLLSRRGVNIRKDGVMVPRLFILEKSLARRCQSISWGGRVYSYNNTQVASGRMRLFIFSAPPPAVVPEFGELWCTCLVYL